MRRRIVIIGGGASGMTAAVSAATAGAEVTVLEQNEKAGKKLLASGNGKCNLTNLDLDVSQYRSDVPALVSSVIGRFDVEETLNWFSTLGLRTFDRNGWVYPRTEQASSVRDLLLWECESRGIRFKNKEEVRSLTREADGIWKVHTAGWVYEADAVVLCCGSPASSVRGSSDYAVRLADQLTIPRENFRPVLVPLCLETLTDRSWNGTRAHAAMHLYLDGREAAAETGELQLTGYGISGIAVFQLSRYAVPAMDEGKRAEIHIDFLPEITAEELEEEWRDRQLFGAKKNYRQLLTGLLPDRLIPMLLESAGLSPESFPRLEEQMPGGKGEDLLRLLKDYCARITGPAPMDQSQICTGGIRLSALNEDLMVTRHPGLYVAGEAAHVDGPCGGYNLQWAWSTGYVAGRAAAEGS